MKKNFLLLTALIFFFMFSCLPCGAENIRINYDLLYKDTPILDFMYEEGVDPKEDKDYEDYIISPYVLIRITDTLRSKKVFLRPGYYLVKPEKKDGYEFLVFKQKGRVAGVVPVYRKSFTVNPYLVYNEKKSKPELPLYKKIPKTIFIDTPKKIISWPFKKMFKQKRIKVPSQSALESDVVGNGKYLDMGLYVNNYLYKVLFKIEN